MAPHLVGVCVAMMVPRGLDKTYIMKLYLFVQCGRDSTALIYQHQKSHTHVTYEVVFVCSMWSRFYSTNIAKSKITYTRHIHPSHDPKSDEYFLKLHTRQGIKCRAVRPTWPETAKMICLEIKSVDVSDSIREQDFQNFQKSFHRTRHQKRGRNLPKNIDEVIATLEEEMMPQSAECAHLIKQVEKEVVMLATDRFLEGQQSTSVWRWHF